MTFGPGETSRSVESGESGCKSNAPLPRVNWRNAHNERRQKTSVPVAPALVSARGNGHSGD
jgi:hypothetical protein